MMSKIKVCRFLPLMGGLFCATFFVLTGYAASSTYYVAPADKGGSDGNPGTKELPFLSLNRAVDVAVAGDTILLADGTNRVDKCVTITEALTIASESGNRSACALDGGDACRIISAESSVLTVSGLTLQRGRATDGQGGAAVWFNKNNRTLTMTNCLVRDCHVSCTETVDKQRVFGGGLYANCKADSRIVDVVVENCTVSVEGAYATVSCGGGGLYLAGGTMLDGRVQDCSVTNASPMATGTGAPVTYGGGAVVDGSATIVKTTFIDCRVTSTSATYGDASIGGAGGGVAFSGVGTLGDCRVEGNSSDCAGGGIYVGPNTTAATAISNCTLRANVLTWPRSCGNTGAGGAALAVYKAEVVMTGCLVENNTATNDAAVTATVKSIGGGIVCTEGVIRLSDSIVRGNAAYNVGGIRLYRTTAGTCISNVVITANRSYEHAGGIKAEYVRAVRMQDVLVTDNIHNFIQSQSVGKAYGVLYISAEGSGTKAYTEILVRNCLFAGNQVMGSGTRWGVYVTGGGYRAAGADPITFDHCTFACNTNSAGNSAFFTLGDLATAQNTLITGCAFYANVGKGRKVGVSGENCTWTELTDLIDHSLSDVVGDAFSATPENHNIDASAIDAATLFVNAAENDFRPASATSPLVDAGGVFEDWMGTGRRKSVQDIGNGSYELLQVGTYGVSVARADTSPRRSGEAPDIGCNEFRFVPGLMILFR